MIIITGAQLLLLLLLLLCVASSSTAQVQIFSGTNVCNRCDNSFCGEVNAVSSTSFKTGYYNNYALCNKNILFPYKQFVKSVSITVDMTSTKDENELAMVLTCRFNQPCGPINNDLARHYVRGKSSRSFAVTKSAADTLEDVEMFKILFYSNEVGDSYCYDASGCENTIASSVYTGITASYVLSCIPGYEWSGTGCQPCNPGTASLGTACTRCESDWYQPSSAQSSCKLCEEGKTTEGARGQTACKTCKAGMRWETTSNPPYCEKCPKNSYNPNEGPTSLSDCKKCDDGKYTESTGQTRCSDCPEGTYQQPSIGGGECKLCDVGKVSTVLGLTIPTLCKLCGKGTFSDAQRTECISCAVGTFQYEAATSCIECQAGYSAGVVCVCMLYIF